MLPLTLLKCDVFTGDCIWVPVKSPEKQLSDVGALRGGSYAKVFNERKLVGFGHATLSSAQHSPFLFILDLIDFKMELSFMEPKMRSTPFSGFSYMDPTSFWQEIQSEKQVYGENQITPVESQKVVKTYVMCTLRAAPDYLSFDQSHHQTIIFQAESKLLTLLEPELEPEL